MSTIYFTICDLEIESMSLDPNCSVFKDSFGAPNDVYYADETLLNAGIDSLIIEDEILPNPHKYMWKGEYIKVVNGSTILYAYNNGHFFTYVEDDENYYDDVDSYLSEYKCAKAYKYTVENGKIVNE